MEQRSRTLPMTRHDTRTPPTTVTGEASSTLSRPTDLSTVLQALSLQGRRHELRYRHELDYNNEGDVQGRDFSACDSGCGYCGRCDY